RLLEMQPANFNARHHLGFMDLVEDRFAEAEQNFKRCLEIDAENPVCSYNLGNVYLETARCGEAIQAFIAALRDPEAVGVAVGARQNLGVAYTMCAKGDGAIREFLEQIKTDPGNPTHHYDLGRIYLQKGLPDQAVNEWENTVKLDPTYCIAYFDLAMYANKLLDTARTIARCQDFIACELDAERTRESRYPDKLSQCKELVRRLELE
ncbi:MAG: tetratricopeptide repeat protein, partial [Myxococcota bacterium]